jgi:NAD-dependent DNA ligase
MNFGLDVNEAGELSLSINSNNQARPASTAQNDFSPSVLFTGFKAADRTRLEKLALDHNYVVRKSVSHSLTFVVGGDNAGPAKIANAKHEGAKALTEAEFIRLLDTGELP